MHEKHGIERRLKIESDRISEEFGGAPVVVIIGGTEEAGVPRTMTASSLRGKNIRLRDLLGILQASIQVESWKHLKNMKRPNPPEG